MASWKIPYVRFRGVIGAAGRGGATVPLPFDPKSEFGKARAPIRGTVNGAPFRSTVAIYGGVAYLGVTKAYARRPAPDRRRGRRGSRARRRPT